MYISRLSFYTRPGHTEEVAQRLRQLADMIVASGLSRPRILRTSFASPGAADLQFEQEIETLTELEHGIAGITAQQEFQAWSAGTSELLLQPPKREILTVEA